MRTRRPIGVLTCLALAGGVLTAASPPSVAGGLPTRSFLARCEDLGQLCFAEGCGFNQIRAETACRTRCPSAVVISVMPDMCVARAPVKAERWRAPHGRL